MVAPLLELCYMEALHKVFLIQNTIKNQTKLVASLNSSTTPLEHSIIPLDHSTTPADSNLDFSCTVLTSLLWLVKWWFLLKAKYCSKQSNIRIITSIGIWKHFITLSVTFVILSRSKLGSRSQNNVDQNCFGLVDLGLGFLNTLWIIFLALSRQRFFAALPFIWRKTWNYVNVVPHTIPSWRQGWRFQDKSTTHCHLSRCLYNYWLNVVDPLLQLSSLWI